VEGSLSIGSTFNETLWFTFFLKSHDVCGSDYAATAKSAPTNAIASSKVIVDNSTAFIV
jgi:hypothetical protein